MHARFFALVLIAATAGPGVLNAFSIRSVTLSPSNVVEPMIEVQMTVDITTPSQPEWLYAPSTVMSTSSGIRVDIYPTSGALTAIGQLRETVSLGSFPSGTYNYEVVIHPNYTVNWGVRTNRGSFVVREPNSDIPEVRILPSTWKTGEPCPVCLVALAAFMVERSGPTNHPLVVNLNVDGTATPGADYQPLPRQVEIPAGTNQVRVDLVPLDDLIAEGPEVVRVRLAPATSSAPIYRVHPYQNEVMLVIGDNGENGPEARLDIIEPREGAGFSLGSIIEVSALGVYMRSEVYGPVEFYDGNQFIGQSQPNATARPPIPGLPSIHTIFWTNPPAGVRVLTARAELSFNNFITSPPVRINIGSTNGTNRPPFVQLNLPRDGDVVSAPASITLRAYAQDPENSYYVQVEFFEGSRSLGFGRFVPTRCAIPYCPYFELVWSNVPPGRYTLTAKAIDQDGASSMSAPVHVTVAESPPRPPFVNIYATDPTATEQPAISTIPPDTATFTVRRSGETNIPLTVYYAISGSASNGVDYQKLTGNVTIPEGALSAEIVVDPIDDNLSEGTETVALTIQPVCPPCLWANPPCLIAQTTTCYQVGTDSHAVANLRDNESNTVAYGVTIVATDSTAVEGPFCRSNWWYTTSGNDGDWTISNPSSTASHCSGTNTAAFQVHWTGPTNSDLRVYYRVSGIASNGVDYLTLPGSVIIPAGHRSARIEVVPIDDSIREPIETVILTLTQPPQNSPSPYAVRLPSRAAAIIVDNDHPRPICARLSDGTFHLCRPGTNGHPYTIRCSTDLVNWIVLCTNSVTDGAVHYVDPDAGNSPMRFYKVLSEPAYSSE